MAQAEGKKYVLGKGKVYFDKFEPGTTVGTGERYIGNTPALTQNATVTNLEHFDSDEGLQVKDEEIQLRVDRGGSFTTDSMDAENIAIIFGSDPVPETQVTLTGESETFEVIRGRYYQLGADDLTPDGVGNITSFSVNDNTGARASGTVNFAGNPSAANTFTLNSVVVTFVAGAPTGNQVQIGATPLITAQALKTFINERPHVFHATAAGAAELLTITAIGTGTEGNSITLARSGSHPTVSGATLSGGTASGQIPEGGNWEMDTASGRFHVLADASGIVDGTTLEVRYNVGTQTRILIVDDGQQVEGALRFISDNPIGTNRNWFWPRVKLIPQGDYALKGETWLQMAFNFTTLQKGSLKRVYVREVA